MRLMWMHARACSLIAHIDSEDAKAQLAMEAQIVEKEKEVLY